MLVDASALVALLTDEDKAVRLAARLQASPQRMVLPQAVVEAVARIAAERRLDAEAVGALVQRFLDRMAIRTVALPAQLTGAAATAMARHGLSPADALAYAGARYYRLVLLHDSPALAASDLEAG
ncbi:hypothetical protein GCM10011390_27730 [Aureimonas endophytica]|uniref:Ribonuclease VapC n=1 Tax=Aureimonas endophytica TaxID=2027858 RepID=A0A916ZP20_9HYPH|nr:type II toxin-antitoxin system VapC family toxin [Aureimonas endophytica]GGE07136.1 hypothetical protein GCM10011390_27730 [Aureimonas endophytica]